MGRPDKRQAILAGALSVFARDGYTRASIDTISAAAGVSTRTIYNHFADKAELFRAVIQDSATRAADAHIAIIDRHLRKVTDLEADLVSFGLDFTATATADHAEHFALVHQISAEIAHIPPAAIEAWQETGPRRVRRELARRLAGLVEAADHELAALHLMRLITPPPPHDGIPTEKAVTAGVRVFLHGYRH